MMPPNAWRPFASRPDHLDVDFRSDDLPRTVTDVLVACADGLDERAAWDLPVSSRIAGLLAIVRITVGGELLETTTLCECGERTSLDLPVDELLNMQGAANDVLVIDGTLRFRRPRGSDQKRWRQTRDADPVTAMLRDLSLDALEGPLPAESIEHIGDALEEFDPLTAMRVELSCPYCGKEQHAAVDLQELCLGELRQVRDGLIREVHTLARAYGWSEDAIVSLPPSRRRQFLRLIEEDQR
jgi:hypothetical protein